MGPASQGPASQLRALGENSEYEEPTGFWIILSLTYMRHLRLHLHLHLHLGCVSKPLHTL